MAITALTVYMINGASTTLTTADLMVTATGGAGTHTSTTCGTSTGYSEIYAQGTGSSWSAAGSIGSPSGNGWLYDVTTLEGQQIVAGNWAPTMRLDTSVGSVTATIYVRAYKRSSGGTYTLIGSSMSLSGQSITTTFANFGFSNTSQPQMNFTTGDKLYVDCWLNITTNSTGSGAATIGISVGNSSTQGQTGPNSTFIVTPGYATYIYKDITVRGKVAGQVYKDVTTRGKLKALGSHDITVRGKIGGTPAYKDVTTRGKLKALGSHDITTRGKLKDSARHDITVRGKIVARNSSGGFTVWANGTGTASFDTFRVTQYPDPSMSLASILPRAGATSVLWNALTPSNTTLGTDISYDGVNWTDMSASNGGVLPNIYSQPSPTVDGFLANSSANYTSTYRTGGAAGTWTFDTTNSRLVATGGTNALYLYAGISRADVDFFADLGRADAGGLVWRYVDQNNFYYLLIGDSLASSGTKNTITLYKVAGNVEAQLGTSAITYTVGSGTSSYTANFTRGMYHRFRVSMLAGAITVYVDGNSLITYTDGSPLAAGLMGLYNSAGATGSRYYQLWIQPQGDSVTGTPTGDIVTGKFVYLRQRLATTDPTVVPQVQDVTTTAFAPTIGAGVTIPAITYNATLVSKNFDDLAKQSNYSWYIDQNKNFVFLAGQSVAAPWILQSAPAGLVSTTDLEVDSNLELDVANDLYRNRQTIIGALATLTDSKTFVGDGSTRTFTLGYPLAAAPSISRNGITQTVGLKGTSGYNFYYALNDAVLTQDASGIVLQATDVLNVPNYTGYYVTNVTVDNVAEQARVAAIEGGSGIVEAVEDHTGQYLTVAAATTLANQLITRYAIAGRTLVFTTMRSGLAIGQTLSIFLPEHGINDGQFLINQVEWTLTKGISDTQVWKYKVTASELPKQASWAQLIASGIGLV